MTLTNPDDLTPGDQAERQATWHLTQAIEEIKAAAALLHHESEETADHTEPDDLQH